MMNISNLGHDDFLQLANDLIEFIGENYFDSDLEKYEPSNREMSILTNLSEDQIRRLRNRKDYKSDRKGPNKNFLEILQTLRLTVVERDKGKFLFTYKPLREDKRLEELAVKLALNHVDVSTEFEEGNTPHHKVIKPHLMKEFRASNKRERFILITGAGASYAATKGVMPLASDAIQYIEEEVKQSGMPLKFIKDELTRISLNTRLDTREFETQLIAYSKYAPEEVIRGLKRICRIKYIPNMIYEILSHVIKHRYVDAALNFNYDEIFDEILRAEISKGDFKFIFSNGHCPESYEKELLVNNRLKHPVYIKPHGTISHTSSLRFANNTRTNFPNKIREIINKLIEAPLPDSEQKQLRVNFIIIGFGMKSPDMLALIKKHLVPNQNQDLPFFWIFDTKNWVDDLELSKAQSELIKKNSHCFLIDKQYSLEMHLKALWGLIEQTFEEDYPSIGIERHELINLIFHSNKKMIEKAGEKDYLIQYFRERIYVEIVLTFLTSDGLLNLTQLMESRVAQYFFQLNKLIKSTSHEHKSIKEYCTDLSLAVYKGFVSDVFTLKEPFRFNSSDLYEDVLENLKERIKNINRKKNIANNKKKILELFEVIHQRNLLNIAPQYQHPHYNIFSDLQDENIFGTSLAWIYRYRSFLEKTDEWDLLLAISERGRFLSEVNKHLFKNKHIEVILSSFDLPEFSTLQDRSHLHGYNFLSTNELYLPWWLHNKHLVLFLKKKHGMPHSNERDNWTIKDGFFYQSRLLSRKVNPIHFNDSSNAENKDYLLEIFANYWYRAKFYTEKFGSDEVMSIPIIKDKIELDGYINEILGKYPRSKS